MTQGHTPASQRFKAASAWPPAKLEMDEYDGNYVVNYRKTKKKNNFMQHKSFLKFIWHGNLEPGPWTRRIIFRQQPKVCRKDWESNNMV